MCQIIALKTTVKKFKKLRKNSAIVDNLQEILMEKGGDYISAVLLSGESKFVMNASVDVEDILNDTKDFFKIKGMKKEEVQLLFFSRQAPEMEGSSPDVQPYYHKINRGLFFAVHGTIHNDEELAKENNVEIDIDTEILQYMAIEDWPRAKGAFVAIGIDDSGLPMIYEHGLRLWKNRINCCGENLADIISTAKLERFDPIAIDLRDTEPQPKTLMASFSGGMDIGLSTFQALSTGEYNKLILNYFAWGSKAEEAEIDQLDKFNDLYSSQFPEVDVEVHIMEAEDYFDDYFKLNEAPFPKISLHNTGKEGEKTEAESPLAYVPYRNTQFAIVLASRAEALQLSNVDFLFGLNLSEGMVYMDNSEGWLDAITSVVKLGGQDPSITGTYNVIAPYFPRTKTNMIQEFKNTHGIAPLEQLLELSYSCYYPDDNNKPCGECGSCILRAKAEENLKAETEAMEI